MSQSITTTDPLSHETAAKPAVNLWIAWKEARQVAPLVFTLLAVMVGWVLLHAFTAGVSRHSDSWALVLLLFPGLFATGAGALLIGQERYERTLQWWSMMPITPQRIWFIKLLAAFCSLVAMWVFALLLVSACQTDGIRPLSRSVRAGWPVRPVQPLGIFHPTPVSSCSAASSPHGESGTSSIPFWRSFRWLSCRCSSLRS